MARFRSCPIPPRAAAAGITRRGISLTELLVSMGLLTLLVAISTLALIGAQRSRAQAQCAANLHALASAFSMYTMGYQDSYPVPTPEAQWEDLLREYVPRSTFRCAADTELFAALGSSYDWRDTGNPRTTLAGRSALQVTHTDAALAFDALPGWHAQAKVQVLRVNSSVELMDLSAFFRDMQRSPTGP